MFAKWFADGATNGPTVLQSKVSGFEKEIEIDQTRARWNPRGTKNVRRWLA
jgi:hypothetical protein